MKRILHIIPLAWLIFFSASCARDADDLPPIPSKGTQVEFSVYLPEEVQVATRTTPVGTAIQNLNVLVFDQAGHFLSRSQAVAGSSPGKYKVNLPQTHPDLPTAERQRILHFIGNYDWSAFSDEANIGKSEKEIVPLLSVSGGTAAYWHRLVLPDGIEYGSLDNTIVLLRNVAKVSVENDTAGGTEYLSDVSFGLGNYLDNGTVAPYNVSSMAFEEGTITEPRSSEKLPVDESDFVTAGQDNAITCYEIRNSTSRDPLFVIVKAKYSLDANPTYYKIDIIGTDQEKLYDIQRNYHYLLRITMVSGPGKETLQEAVDNPAANNLKYSVYFQDYTSISDRTSVLNVETTQRTFVNANNEFSISFSYIPDISTGVEDNSGVTFELQQDDAKPVVDRTTYQVITDAGSARLIGRTGPNVPERDIYSAVIKVSAKNGTLQRMVRLYLRRPFEFGNVYTTPSVVPGVVDQHVDLHFTIPDNINPIYFPMPIYITTNKLAPNSLPSCNSNLTRDDQVQGKYRHVYTARGPGEHIAHFVTNSNSTSETLKLEGDLFTPAQVNLVPGNLLEIQNLYCDPNGAALSALTGVAVGINFTIPPQAVPPLKVQIRTSKLTAYSSTSGTFTAKSYGYDYIAHNTGPQMILCHTNTNDSQETLAIDGDQFKTARYARTCALFEFQNVSVTPNPVDPSNKGTNVTLKFTIPSGYYFGSAMVFIATRQLIPADGNPSGLSDLIVHKDYGTGYIYNAGGVGEHTVQFKTRDYYSEEVLAIGADGFVTSYIQRRSPFTFPVASFDKKPRTQYTNWPVIFTVQVPEHSISPNTGRLFIRIYGDVFKYDIDRLDLTYDPEIVSQPAPGSVVITRDGYDNNLNGYFGIAVTRPGEYKIRFFCRTTGNTSPVKLMAERFNPVEGMN